MKTLLIVGLLSFGQAANASCEITLYKKSPLSKTSYTLEGDSISLRVIEKLSSQCKFTIKNMSATQKKSMQIKSLQKRLKKLRGVK